MYKRINYSVDERRLLAALVHRHKSVLECKLTNGGANTTKNRTWKLVQEEFNAKRLNAPRDVRSLRKLWSNMKVEAKRRTTSAASNTSYDADLVTLINDSCVFDEDDVANLAKLNELKPVMKSEHENNAIIADEAKNTEGNTEERSVALTWQAPNELRAQPQGVIKFDHFNDAPLLDSTDALEEAKLDVLRAQRDLYLMEKNYRMKILQLEYEHKKKLSELTIARLNNQSTNAVD